MNEQRTDDDVPVVRTLGLPTGLWIIVLGGFGALAVGALNRFSGILAPAFLALTLVLTVRPLHRAMIRRGVPPALSALGTVLVLVGVLSGIIGLTVVAFIPLPDVIASYQGNFQDLIDSVTAFFQNSEFLQKRGYSTDSVESIIANLDLDTLIGAARSAIAQLSSIGALVTVIALSILFIVVDTMRMDARSSIVEQARPELYEALCGFEGRVRQYWLVSTIFGALVAVFDWLALEALGIPLTLAWALVSFVTNYIPNVGFVLGLVPPALFGLLEGGWQLMAWVIVAYSLINFIIQSLLQPKFTADAVGLSTTVTFLSLMVWGVVIGPLGALLAVPLTLFFKAVLIDSSASTRWIDAFLTSEADAAKNYADGRYDVSYESPDAWGSLQAAVEKVAETIRRPSWRGDVIRRRKRLRTPKRED